MIRSSFPISSANRGRRPLISLTPLIDVVFILLVFFMLASSFTNWKSIELSGATGSQFNPATHPPVLVEVLETGVRYAGQVVTPENLYARVGELLAKSPDQTILVRPGTEVAIQEVVILLDAFASRGAKNLVIVGND